MQIIFDKMKKGEDINEFKDVLKGGKGDKKQHENLQKVGNQSSLYHYNYYHYHHFIIR